MLTFLPNSFKSRAGEETEAFLAQKLLLIIIIIIIIIISNGKKKREKVMGSLFLLRRCRRFSPVLK